MVWIIVANGDWTRIGLGKCEGGEAVPVAMEIDEATFERLRAGELDADADELRMLALRTVPIPDAVACAVFVHDLIDRSKAVR